VVHIDSGDVGKNKKALLEVKRWLLGRGLIPRTAAVAPSAILL